AVGGRIAFHYRIFIRRYSEDRSAGCNSTRSNRGVVMKILKEEIQLSPLHPSLQISLAPEKLVMNPVVIGRDRTLIDGYRRYQLCPDAVMEAFEMEGDLFQSAVSLNFRTRKWDEA